jgi:NADP-dependent 3-hydroxy acid dehydrogenase YdfG
MPVQRKADDSVANFHTETNDLNGKRILVSGGTTGIGRAIAGLLASYGSKVFVFGREGAALNDALVAFRGAGGDVTGTIGDVAKASDIEKVFEAARDALGSLDIYVDNAGVSGEGIVDMADKDWRYVVEANLVGAMATAREAVLWMKERGAGHVVIIGSISAERENEGSSVYVATKSGLRGFAESLHKEVRRDGIKVTLIEPGEVGSDMQQASPSAQRRKIKRGEMLRAEDIAVATHFAVTQPGRCDVTFLQIRPHSEQE